MPREAIVPPPDPPVIVEDDRYTTRVPSNERDNLRNALVYLSERLFHALEVDKNDNNRYARRLHLINHKYNQERKLITDRIEILLPIESSAWNDLDLNDIQVCLLFRVLDIESSYYWYKIKLEFHQFISHQTKVLMDKMDEEADSIPQTTPKPTGNKAKDNVASTPLAEKTDSTSVADSTPDVDLGELRDRKTVQTNAPDTNSKIDRHKTEVSNGSTGLDPPKDDKPSFTEPKPAPVIETISSDDDDEISVVFESVAPAKKELKTSNG